MRFGGVNGEKEYSGKGREAVAGSPGDWGNSGSFGLFDFFIHREDLDGVSGDVGN